MYGQNIGTEENKIAESKFRSRIKDDILLGPECPIHRESVNFAETILKTLKSKPDCIGQIDAFTNKRNTYAEMTERSIKCALWLKKQGVKPGDIIGHCIDHNLDAITVLLGIIYLNAKCNTWDYELSITTARYFLSLTSPTIIFTIPLSAANLTEAAKQLKIDVKIIVLGKLDGYESLDDILRNHDSCEIAEFECIPISNPDEIGLIIYSSGTTGMPKATEFSHSSIHNCLATKFVETEVCTNTTTLRWIYGITMSLSAILSYSTKIIMQDFVIDNISHMCQFIKKYRVTFLATEPNILIQILKMYMIEKYQLSSLQIIITSGSNFSKEQQEELRKKLPHTLIINAYGCTDAGGKLTCQDEHSKLGSVGYPISNVQIKVADTETEKVLGVNKVGEIRVKTPFTMNGYYGNPEATKKAFDSDTWFRTGDLGYYDDDGELFIVDRMSEFINFNSISILPAKIESILQTHPAVFQVAVIGIPHEINNELPMAIVSVVPGTTVTEQELMSLVENNLPNYCKLRAGVKFMDELPRTSTRKIAKKKLREMFAN